MKLWTEIILEWLNCLDILETNVKELKELDDGNFYNKLIELFSWKGAEDITDTKHVVIKFLQDEYPKYQFDDKDMEQMEHVYISSLFLLRVSQEPLFYQPMCIKLQHSTQLKIKTFLEMIIPYGRDIEKETLRKIIAEIENDTSEIPVTPKAKILQHYLTSPAVQSSQRHKILTERNRELRMLRTELEVERFEKIDLQEDLRIQQNRIQNLHAKLKEKTAEIKALREEKMMSKTPQSAKKCKETLSSERYYKKEIDHLENQLIQKQCEIDKLETDNDSLTKKLTCVEKQCIYFKEKTENYEKALKDIQIQMEVKDNELMNLKMTNEELYTHLNELNKTSVEEKSFEIDEVVPLHSLSTSLNNSEILSSVIEIQLQEAKKESASLKNQLDTANKKLEFTNFEYENTVQLLEEKTQLLQNTETKFNETINNLNVKIESLQKEQDSLKSQNKSLEELCNSQKESLLNVEGLKNALTTIVTTLKEKIEYLEKSLCNQNIDNDKLNSELEEVKSQMHENLKSIQNLTDQNNLYKTSIDLYNKNLKEIAIYYLESDCIEDNNLDNKTTTELIEHLQTILCNFNKKYTLKEAELQSLNNTIDEAKLELKECQSQIFNLEEKDKHNITEISKLKETATESAIKINELATIIEHNSTEISHLKEIKLHKEALEKDLSECKEEIKNRNLLVQAIVIYIKRLKENIQAFKTEFYLMKKDIVNRINEYQKQNQETSECVLNAYNKLYVNYTQEQLHQSQLKDELANNEKNLKDSKNLNITLQNEVIKNKETINNLETELINTKEKLTESAQKLVKLEKTKDVFEKQYNDLKFENEKILLCLNDINDKLKVFQEKACNMSEQLKVKDEKIGSLVEEIASIKLEKDRVVHLQMENEAELKNFIKIIETKLLEKQHYLDQLSTEVKLKEKTSALVQDKFEKLSKETIASEIKLKEVITSLQEVRTNQDAVLVTQEKALQEKCFQLEQFQKEFNESKEVLRKQLETEKVLSHNLQSTNSELQMQSYKQKRVIEELQETLKKVRNELNESKEYCKNEEAQKLEIVEVCAKLQHLINDLKLTVVKASTKNENSGADILSDTQYNNDTDKTDNILKTLRTSVTEIYAIRTLILDSLNETLKNQKLIVDNYDTKCEEIKLLKIKVEELNSLKEKHVKRVNTLLKHKESLNDHLKNIIKSRENLDTLLAGLKQKWDKLLTNSHDIFMMDKSICDDLKHIYAEKMYLENTLFKHYIYHFQNMKPLQTILWNQFLWTEQRLSDSYLKTENAEEILNGSPDVFSDEKIVIEAELCKNEALQQDIVQLQNKVADFSNLITSFENKLKSNEIELQSESEKKLHSRIDELTEDKNHLESKLNCARIKNAKLESDIDELRIKIQEMKVTSLKELEDLGKELMELKEEKLKLKEEMYELSKRPRKEDVDNQLKDIHDKYKVKVDEIKQNMKIAYSEQIAKMNKEQEQLVESLQRKMELQCRKQADELSKYKAHVAVMSSQFWNVGEKLLGEQQEKEKLRKELIDLKSKYQSFDKKLVSSIEHKTSKHEKRDLVGENKEVLQKISVTHEKTTYERRCSIRSIQTMGNAFHAEDEEGEVFNNTYLDRLSILKKRNALCKPHLKSSYPAETQFNPTPFTEEEIKAGSVAEDMFNDSLSQSLLPEQKTRKKDRTQTSYKKPGPPTPSKNGGRLSLQGNEIKSPNSRILKERNKERATATPRKLKSLFTSRRQDENVIVTPRNRRRSSIFRKYYSGNDR
ncbi:mushroom body defect isoform X2 [Xylocopa sonorina]|uniref:mushroom body defect isoform X2 n=1 Tax=Xylocopa sonorina TaxID=1818115 RepID=UPI00403AF6EC